jgi:hypothetical protein
VTWEHREGFRMDAKHTKEPWEIIRTSNGTFTGQVYSGIEDKVVCFSFDAENAERIIACVNACNGLTNEVLDKGILEDAIALVLNAGKDIGITWDGMAPYYEGVKVWED